MKKTLMIYYSFEGNTACAADFLSQYPDIDAERLTVEKEPPKKGFGKFLLGGKSAVMKEDPGLRPIEKDPEEYDNIILGFPVWANTYPPAIGAFLKKYPMNGKNIFIVACSSSGSATKATDNARKATPGCLHKGAVSLTDPLKDKEAAFAKLRELAEEIEKA
ncbi:MAG: flavodoxin [Ruminococcus sp.]|nr:flavodoxin [Ruminococcus sp.]